MFDLRSDTITQPTEAMRKAMAAAEVGDDVFAEDRTVNRLQELAAEKAGKEAGLFVPSGTMGNLIAILTHTHNARCGEVICEESSHVRLNEAGGMAALGGLMCCPVKGERGAMRPEDVRASIRTKNIHHPNTALICVENTHNYAGGAVVPLSNMAAIRNLAKEYGIPVHLDGARAFNAAAALNVPLSDITRYADSANLCISKGLSAPVGSLLVGMKDFIEQARHYRKLLGGGMRQAGVLAAAGIIAITEMAERLYEDNENAHALAVGLAGMKGIGIDPRFVQSNIVIFDVQKTGMTAAEFAEKLKGFGVLASTTGPYSVRFVTNRHISSADLPQILKAVHQMLLSA
ncbi:MAG: GntG family PLP-dependent aldolase [Christensenellales bacterium]|jgi:threonine aldolase